MNRWARVASFWQRMAFRSTGTILMVRMEKSCPARGPDGLTQREEKSHPLSAAEAMLE